MNTFFSLPLPSLILRLLPLVVVVVVVIVIAGTR